MTDDKNDPTVELDGSFQEALAQEGESVPSAPYDRMKRGYDEFSDPQAVIESWADAELTDTFREELVDMRVSDVRALMDTAASVAAEHRRRAERADRVRVVAQQYLLDVADMPQARVGHTSEAKTVGPGRG